MKDREPFGGAYRGTKVLITGHTGFKGAWLAVWLKHLGAEVAGFSLDPPTRPSLFEIIALDRLVDHRVGDIRDFDCIQDALGDFQPCVVFHLAAQAIVRRSYRIPRETMETNVQGTVNLLEAARLGKSVKSLVIVTSDKCYEEAESSPGYVEEDRLGGGNPYSASKGMAELAVAAYQRSFFSFDKGNRRETASLGIATARAGNVIGGGDFGEDRLVPDCIRALTAGQPIEVRMPSALRPWLFVLDPLSGYLQLGAGLLADPSGFGGPWNFGPLERDGLNAKALAERVITLWGDGRWEKGKSDQKLAEASILRLNWDKARQVLGWRPVYTLDQAITETVSWYRAFQDRESSQQLQERTIRQIQAYERQALTRGVSWIK
ncbi:MAG: CDP-glucose 4,6-dehydratase [Planctomycetes bacterium]|nr:CDP-glucose 4,6-dehydratase [Planctomycetota bacterium]